MKKRVLAALLCVAMVATMLVGCTQAGTEPTETGSEKDTTTSSGLSVEPVVYYPMESADEGWKIVVADATKAANNAYDPSNIDGARGIVDGDASLLKTVTGVKGNSVYLDRNYALDLNFKPTNSDEWSVSFWVCTTGMTDYMASLQMGNNIGYTAGAGNNVTWLNVTQTSWVGATYPVLWSRNEASAVVDENGTIVTDCFPWMSAYDSEKLIYGLKEWVNITIVATGDIYDSPVGTKVAGAQLYIDGELRFDSYDNFMNATYFEVTDTEANATMAPNIMKPAEGQTFEAYFGINYWDNLFKGCVDEFYVFDKAITAEDAAALYAMGDPSVVPEMSTEGDPKENPREQPSEGSIEFIGANNYTQAWWTMFSEIREVKAGETKTITFKNYHTGLTFANWNNGAVVLQNTPTGHSITGTENGVDPVDGYAEYAVLRMDNFGWGLGYGTATLECDWDWATFNADTHGATVVLTITNNGETADVTMEVTSADGATVRHQSYKGISIKNLKDAAGEDVDCSSLYVCLTVEKACIDIIDVK